MKRHDSSAPVKAMLLFERVRTGAVFEFGGCRLVKEDEFTAIDENELQHCMRPDDEVILIAQCRHPWPVMFSEN